MRFLTKLFGDRHKKEVKKLWRFVEEVNSYDERMKALKESQFPELTARFKERLAQGETLDDILPEAFALAREAAWRTLGMRPFDVQVLGGIVLHQGRIAEMKTGEGKTLAATMPAYLNALTGRGVHIVTVNDYLARRDSEWMKPVYELLGLTVGVIVNDLKPAERRAAYHADITYGTNNEFGFDYLRDNMVTYKEHLVQRPPHYAIVDEVDSILIDEARTPLIISGRMEETQQEYARWNKAAEKLVKTQDRLVRELLQRAQEHLEKDEVEQAVELLYLARRGSPKNRTLLEMLKEPGLAKRLEKFKQQLSKAEENQLDEELYYTIDEVTKGVNITAQKGYDFLAGKEPELRHLLGRDDEDSDIGEKKQDEAIQIEDAFRTLIRAYSLYQKDVDYVVQDDKVIIVDEFTGRLMPGRRYSEGLHQAIEAKEGVTVQGKTQTVATITFQNYFRMYAKLAGMTGTAVTEEEEFTKIYGMDVVVIPTNKEMIREDLPDLVYRTEKAKFNAVVEEIARRHQEGQPILVGTISIEKSEHLSRMLSAKGLPHHVLNAKFHEKEAEIVAQAGQKGALTIATNMAGRGTDIVLGGNIEHVIEKIQNDKSLKEEQKEQKIRQLRDAWRANHEEVVRLGGLHIIGTERHESRRIDNQLRGRAGRQGDPGSSQFFVSLEDDLMRLFGSDNVKYIMEKLGMEEDAPIDHPIISRAIENAQKKVEGRNFEIRKNILEYDDVLNKQREIIYSQRRQVLEGENLKDNVMGMIDEIVDKSFSLFVNEKQDEEEWDMDGLLQYAEKTYLPPGYLKSEDFQDLYYDEARDKLKEAARTFYDERENEMGSEIMRELERVVILRTVDAKWMVHLDAMHDLRQEIWLRAYGQRDPLVEYKYEAYEMFQAMIYSIQEEVVRLLFHLKVTQAPERQRVATPVVSRKAEGVGAMSEAKGGNNVSPEKQKPVNVNKVGRNEPCPCGSGKKYKKCCGAAQGR